MSEIRLYRKSTALRKTGLHSQQIYNRGLRRCTRIEYFLFCEIRG